MRITSKYLCSLFLVLLSLQSFCQRPKRVYLTLDVSGSMYNEKYMLANYTTQMLTTLCDDNDKVYLIINGEQYNQDTKVADLRAISNPLEFLQKPIEDLSTSLRGGGNAEIGAIWKFNKEYSPSDEYEDWLFIVGDGMWATEDYPEITKDFSGIVQKGTLNVCFLQTDDTMSPDNDFTVYLKGLGVVDIGKSSKSPSTIIEGCDHYARKILGFSETPLSLKKSGSNGVKMTSELPIKKFFVVYQDKVLPAALPNLDKVECDGSSVPLKLKGTPSSEKTASSDASVDISGRVWLVEPLTEVAANTPFILSFDKNINVKNVKVYPYVDASFASMGLTHGGGSLKQIDYNTYSICRDEKSALVRIEPNAGDIPASLLKKTTVEVVSGGQKYPAKYNNGAFECVIPLEAETTLYYAECDCPGYFKRVTPTMRIVKGDCPSAEMAEKEMPETEFGSISVSQLMRGDEIQGYIYDSETNALLDPNLFDFSGEISNGYLFEDPQITVEDGLVKIRITPRGEWCDCLLPEELHVKLISSPKGNGDIDGRYYIRTTFPLLIKVVKEDPWLARCMWLILAILGLLLFLIYLRGLTKKCRFGKNARIEEFYTESYEETRYGGKYLREKGLLPWLNRWLNPFGPEKRTLKFQASVPSTFHFEASESSSSVKIAASDYDEDRMSLEGYILPTSDKDRKKPILWTRGRNMELQERTEAGRLQFEMNGHDDVPSFKVFLGILKLACIALIIALIFMLIKSFV